MCGDETNGSGFGRYLKSEGSEKKVRGRNAEADIMAHEPRHRKKQPRSTARAITTGPCRGRDNNGAEARDAEHVVCFKWKGPEISKMGK